MLLDPRVLRAGSVSQHRYAFGSCLAAAIEFALQLGTLSRDVQSFPYAYSSALDVLLAHPEESG